MATNTSNYNLIKPGQDDFYDIDDFNQNADVIDAQLKNVNDKADNAQNTASYAATTAEDVQDTLNTHLSDYVRQPGYGVTSGSANTYTLTLSPAPAAYTDGMGIVVKINVANTGAATINVNGLGAKPMVDGKGSALATGKLKINAIYSLKYNSTSGNFILQGEGGEIPKLPNLVSNGNFKDTSGWAGFNATVSVVNNNILNTTGDGTYKSVYTFNANNNSIYPYTGGVGKKIWITARVRVTNAVCNSFVVYVSNKAANASPNLPYIFSPTQNVWCLIRGVLTLTFDDTYKVYIRSDYADAATANGKVMQVKDVMMFDLTEYFGAGNEPTAEEVAMMVDKKSKNIFDGVLEFGGFNVSGVPTINDNIMRSKNFISIIPSTNYVASKNGVAANMGFFYYDQNKTFISFTSNTQGLFTTPSNAYFLKVSTITSGENNIYDHVQVELGATVTPFEYYLKYDWWDSDLPLLTSDADAVSGDILSSKVAYANGLRLAGSMPNKSFSATGGAYTPASSWKADGGGALCIRPQEGYYKNEVNAANGFGPIIANDPNFIPQNIVSGKSIFGLAGSFTGKRWASGTVLSSTAGSDFQYVGGGNISYWYVSVSGLTFKPSFILLKGISTPHSFMTTYDELGLDYPKSVKVFSANSNALNANILHFKGDAVSAIVTNTGFVLPVNAMNLTFSWIAFE